jgi:hypothetical protein
MSEGKNAAKAKVESRALYVVESTFEVLRINERSP